jgi:hypothetical protein
MTDFNLDQNLYDNIFNKFEHVIKFKDRSLDQWKQALTISELTEDFSLHDLEIYTLNLIKLTQLVIDNYSLAKANYTGLKSSSAKHILIQKQVVLTQIEQDNLAITNNSLKKRVPTADILETLAYNKTIDIQNAYILSEVFYEFWSAQYSKIQLLNTRLTSLNILKNIESKI